MIKKDITSSILRRRAVREDEMIEKREIGMNIGELDNEASDETGGYWGNASTFI